MAFCTLIFSNFIFYTWQVKREYFSVCTRAAVDGNYDRHGLDSASLYAREEWTSKPRSPKPSVIEEEAEKDIDYHG